MRQDFVDKLELELRAAGERRARPWRIARRQLLTPALAAVGVLAIAVVLAATVLLRSEDTIPAQPGPRLLASQLLVGAGAEMAVASGSVWVADPPKEQVLRLDPRTRAVEARIPVGGQPWLSTAGGAVWALGRDRLLRIDPARDRVVTAIPMPDADPGRVLEGRGAVWVASTQALRRVDLRSNAITRTVQTSRDAFMNVEAVSDGRILYIARADGRLLRFDAGSGRRLSAVRAPLGPFLGVAGGVVFVGTDSGVSAVDAATGRTRWTRDLRATQVNNGALDGATVWVQASDRATRRDRLWRLDARTGHVTGSLGLPEFGAPGLVTVGKQVWTMSIGGDLQVALKKG